MSEEDPIEETEETEEMEEVGEVGEPDEFGDEPSGGVLAPNDELEAALQDAVSSMEAREQEKAKADSPKKAPPTSGMSVDDLAKLKEAKEAAQAVLEGKSDASAEIEALNERLVRLQADFENFRRRTIKERDNFLNYGHENLVKDLLPTVDNLERAIEHTSEGDGGDVEGLLEGVNLVLRELLVVLAKYGVGQVQSTGQPFDPEIHEAMAQEPTNAVPPNTVTTEYQKGYKLRDRLLRPSRVVVSKAMEE